MEIYLLDIANMEEEEIKKKLDDILSRKTKDIEVRRDLKLKKQKEALEMEDGALKRRIEYEMKNDKLLSSHDESRNLHESYQFLMREYEARYKMAMVWFKLILIFYVNLNYRNIKDLLECGIV